MAEHTTTADLVLSTPQSTKMYKYFFLRSCMWHVPRAEFCHRYALCRSIPSESRALRGRSLPVVLPQVQCPDLCGTGLERKGEAENA